MKNRQLILFIYFLMQVATANTAWATSPAVWSKAKRLYQEGLACKRSGKEAEARQYFVAAIRTDSSFTAAYSELGSLYFEQKAYANALLYTRKAQQLGAVKTSRLTGFCSYYLGQYDQAMEALEQARTEAPADVSILHQLALTYAQLGDYRACIHACMELLSLQTDAGIHCLYEVRRYYPKDEQVLYQLAHAFYRQRCYEEAVEEWKELLHLQPNNPFIMFMLGKSYMGKGDTVKGTALCDQAWMTGEMKKT
ncbi:tetratricopeptide repeat protein [Chitinophaga nivalis]|uniref:Tetratricopeptide repeat protein n=1 Tax=Chitinophaga nivalis TaxID=2991709 RepID=A0ABT3IR85_9BACT|nr:tetratricopeptide repeat protein [Chitinophaga nivalis]MCW3463819.1 tetratricopeptide repeat protein [Chitinophaga nivalis]MCW3486491.1 tetratricopeptide repeat protein [Chitinophaga nivalis]